MILDSETYGFLDNFTEAQRQFALLIFSKILGLPADGKRVDAQLDFSLTTLENISLCTAGSFSEIEEMMYKTIDYQVDSGHNSYSLVNHFKHHPSKNTITVHVNETHIHRMLKGKSKTGKKINDILNSKQ